VSTTREDSASEEFHEVGFSASLPAADAFLRARPAELEGPEEAWRLARAVVDYGCAILKIGPQLRPDRRIRDAVLAALLRRLLITSESAVILLSKGLVESAMSQTRTLLDIELAFRLIHSDQSDNFAKKLAAFHYLTYQEHGQDMLSSRRTRENVLNGPGRIPEVITITKGYARFLEASVFDEVRDDVRRDRFWHGFQNVEEAFRHIGSEHDYFMTYDSATWFIHAVNVDHDFAELDDSGLSLKPLVERNPSSIQPLLGHVILRSLELLALYLEDTGLNLDERAGGNAEMQLEDGSTIPLASIDGLRMLVLRQFDVREKPFGCPATT
jgi:hypothetical protein